MQYMYKAYILTYALVIWQKIFPDFVQISIVAQQKLFYNETFTIYAQDITNYEYLKNIFDYYSDF
jgi:hypothetical protein